MISEQIRKLQKKLQRIERKYERLPDKAIIPKMRLAKSYNSTVSKISKLIDFGRFAERR